MTPVDDAKRGLNEFPQEFLTELGYHAPNVWIIGECLDPSNDLHHESFAHIGHALFRVPVPQCIEIAQRGFGDTDTNPGHWII